MLSIDSAPPSATLRVARSRDLCSDSLPQARIVRTAGQLVPPPPPPRVRRHRRPSVPVREQLRTVAAYAVGLWPLTSVALLAVGLLWIAAMSGSP